MKKTFLVTLLLVFTSVVFAQKKKVNEANDLIEKAQGFIEIQNIQGALENLKNAQTAIDAAVTDPSTSDKYDTWVSRSIVYTLMGQLDESNASKYIKTAHESVMKAYELDKKKTLKHDKVVQLVSNIAFNYYNQGINSMNTSQYKNAQHELTQTYQLLNFDDGKLFPKASFADTIKMKSNYYAGICAYYASDFNTSISMLEEAINHPITSVESNAYVTLANAYSKAGKRDKQLEVINKGKAKFKNDPNMATAEINYYIEAGELETVTKKINEELAQDPERDDLYYNLGLINIELIKKGVKEEEEVRLYAEALKNFQKANVIKPEFRYDYLIGLSAFNAGAIYNNKINNVYDEKEQGKLEKERNVYFDQAIVYYKKVHEYYSSKDKNKLSSSDLSTWQQALIALKEIYMAYDNVEEYRKYNELIQKL